MKTTAYLLLLVFIFILSLTSAQETNSQAAASEEKRYYFIGTVGPANEVQMELVFDGEDVSGSYYYDKKGIPIGLSGSYAAKDGAISMSEKGYKGLITGNFKGKVVSDGKDFAKSLEGSWTDYKGERKLPFVLTKVSDFVSSKVTKGDKIESSLLYPKFISDDQGLKMINSELSKNFKTEQDKFLKEAKEFFSTEDSAGGWEDKRSYSIAYYSLGLISLVGEVYSYTGGAHGNTYYISSNYSIKEGKAELLKLSQLFNSGSDYLKALSKYCINDLLVKKAGWVENGEITSFKEDELGVFAISPEGLKFAFAPYAVGPYVQGSFFVTVPFEEIKGIIDPKGALGVFLKPSTE